jgi:hypothetical protein
MRDNDNLIFPYDLQSLAAHGEFQQFKRIDAEKMIAGINSYLAEGPK